MLTSWQYVVIYSTWMFEVLVRTNFLKSSLLLSCFQSVNSMADEWTASTMIWLNSAIQSSKKSSMLINQVQVWQWLLMGKQQVQQLPILLHCVSEVLILLSLTGQAYSMEANTQILGIKPLFHWIRSWQHWSFYQCLGHLYSQSRDSARLELRWYGQLTTSSRWLRRPG